MPLLPRGRLYGLVILLAILAVSFIVHHGARATQTQPARATNKQRQTQPARAMYSSVAAHPECTVMPIDIIVPPPQWPDDVPRPPKLSALPSFDSLRCDQLRAPNEVTQGTLDCCVTGLLHLPLAGLKEGRRECNVEYAEDTLMTFSEVLGHRCGDLSVPLPDTGARECVFAFRGSIRNSSPVVAHHCRKEGPAENAGGGASGREERINREALWMWVFMGDDACVSHADNRWSRRDAVWNNRHTVSTRGWWTTSVTNSTLQRPKKYFEESLALLQRTSDASFQHFIIDPLVNVVTQMHILPDVRPLHNPMSNDQMRLYTLAGGSEEKLATFKMEETACSKKGVWFNLLVALRPPFNELDPYHRISAQHAMIISHLQSLPPPTRRRLVYLQRGMGTNLGYRDVVNEKAILDLLRKFIAQRSPELELLVFSAAEFSWEQTLSAMRSAKLIVGVHGGAVANAIFASSDAAIIEFCRSKPDAPAWTSYYSNGWETRPHTCVQRRLINCGQVTSYIDLDELEAALELWKTGLKPAICYPSKIWHLVEDPVVKKLREGTKK